VKAEIIPIRLKAEKNSFSFLIDPRERARYHYAKRPIS